MTNFRLKEFADNNFKFDENGRKFSKRTENTVGQKRNCSLEVSKRLVLHTRKKQGLFGKRLKHKLKLETFKKKQNK